MSFEVFRTDDWVTIRLNGKVINDNHYIDLSILPVIAVELGLGYQFKEEYDPDLFDKLRETFIKEGFEGFDKLREGG